jgi:hypothetical protein
VVAAEKRDLAAARAAGEPSRQWRRPSTFLRIVIAGLLTLTLLTAGATLAAGSGGGSTGSRPPSSSRS